MAIKRITAANENLTSGRPREQAQAYWADSHGKLVANRPTLLRYHHYFSVPEAYDAAPRPTFIGISMFWNQDPLAIDQMPPGAWWPIGPDDRQLFDREPRWPRNDQHADILGEEHVIVDGEVSPGMINAIFMVCRVPGLNLRACFDHWLNVHGPLAARVPGVRRYVQCHGVLEAMNRGTNTHDGWSEMWFDDFASFQSAVASPEWKAMEEDGRTLFCEEKGIVIGTEYIQKDDSWRPRDYGVLAMTEDQVRERLKSEGYTSLASDPKAPATILAAAAKEKLGVWTPEHLVTLDDTQLDARPDR